MTQEQQKDSMTARLVHGITGLTKAVVGLDYPGDEVVKKRWEICKSCEFFRLWQCTRCSCWVSAKIRVKSEFCPVSKWKAIE